MTTQVRAAALTGYFDVASQLELDTEPILRAAGISRALLDDPDQRIPVTTVLTLLDEAARASGCESFGLCMAATRQLADLGAISLLLMHQATLRDALRTLIRYRSLMNESLAMLVEDAGTTVIVREEIVLEDAPVSRQAIELATGTLHRACSVLLGRQWNPHSVHFTHDAPADLVACFACKPSRPLTLKAHAPCLPGSVCRKAVPQEVRVPKTTRPADPWRRIVPGGLSHSMDISRYISRRFEHESPDCPDLSRPTWQHR